MLCCKSWVSHEATNWTACKLEGKKKGKTNLSLRRSWYHGKENSQTLSSKKDVLWQLGSQLLSDSYDVISTATLMTTKAIVNKPTTHFMTPTQALVTVITTRCSIQQQPVCHSVSMMLLAFYSLKSFPNLNALLIELQHLYVLWDFPKTFHPTFWYKGPKIKDKVVGSPDRKCPCLIHFHYIFHRTVEYTYVL